MPGRQRNAIVISSPPCRRGHGRRRSSPAVQRPPHRLDRADPWLADIVTAHGAGSRRLVDRAGTVGRIAAASQFRRIPASSSPRTPGARSGLSRSRAAALLRGAGYHRWRRIYPLAFVAQVPGRLGWGGQRRAGAWLQAHAYHLMFLVFVVSLWLRLVATNGDGRALAVFLLTLCGAALRSVSCSRARRGATTCAPSPSSRSSTPNRGDCVTRLTRSAARARHAGRRAPTSTRRTASGRRSCCRPSATCPRVSWRGARVLRVLLPPVRHLGEPLRRQLDSRDRPGAYGIPLLVSTGTPRVLFWPRLPRAVAAALTLVAGAALSYAAFRTLEPALGRVLRRRGSAEDDAGLRSVTFTLAAFAGFVTFYSFAGAPTLRLVPALPHVFQLVVMTTATLFLVRRAGGGSRRSQKRHSHGGCWRTGGGLTPTTAGPARSVSSTRIRSRSQNDARRQMLDVVNRPSATA